MEYRGLKAMNLGKVKKVTKNNFLSLPKKSQDVIKGISLKFHEKVENIVLFYQSYYNSKIFKERFSNTPEGVIERHNWALEFVIDSYKAKSPPDIRNLIFFGKSPINAFSVDDIHIKFWVVDTQTKEILLVKKCRGEIESEDVDQIIFFIEYDSVMLEPDTKLDFQMKRNNFPMMTTNYVLIGRQQFFQKLGIKRIQMKNLRTESAFSLKNDNGYYDLTDIRCIPECTFTRSASISKSISGFEYELGQIFITDGSTDEYTTDDGLTIPSNFMCWVHPDYIYPKNTIADIYGVIRLNKKGEVVMDVVYVDVRVEGIEKDDNRKMEIVTGKRQIENNKYVERRKKVKKGKNKAVRLNTLLE